MDDKNPPPDGGCTSASAADVQNELIDPSNPNAYLVELRNLKIRKERQDEITGK